MAVKKILADGHSYQDLFDTQDALDQGILGSVDVGTKSWSAQQSFAGIKGSKAGGTSRWMAGASDLGTILGQADAIAANKKRKKEQNMAGANGFGGSNSILGGAGF